VPVDVPEGMDRRALQATAAGGPTGLFTVYAQQSQTYAFGRLPPPVTKLGGITPRSGIGTVRGQGSGSGSGGNTGGGAPSPPNMSPVVTVTASAPTEEEKGARLRAKLQPDILALVQRIALKHMPEIVNHGGFVRDRKAEVQLWLTDKSELTKAKLKELGFEVVLDHANSNLIIGRIPVDKLAALAELASVRYVSPQISK
jgi:hypothetical protein